MFRLATRNPTGQKNGMLLLRKNFSAGSTSTPGLSGLHIPTASALEGKLFNRVGDGGGSGTREGTGQAGTTGPGQAWSPELDKHRKKGRAC